MISIAPPLDSQPSSPAVAADSITPISSSSSAIAAKSSTTTTTTTTTKSTTRTNSSSDIIFRSKLPDIPIPNHLPLHTYCFQNLPVSGDRPCLIVGSTGKTYTHAETHLISRKVASGLSDLGISRGDVIMVLLPNCPEFVFTFLGGSMVGAVTTAANPFCTPSEILKHFKASGAKIIVTQSGYVHKLRWGGMGTAADHHDPSSPAFEGGEGLATIGKDFTVITVDDPPEGCLHFSIISEAAAQEISDDDQEPLPGGQLQDDHNKLVKKKFSPDDPVALPFSSGTTGLPKGVVLTHRSLITSVSQLVDGENPNLHLRGEDVVLCVLPLFHIFSLQSVLLCSLRAGSAVLLMHKFEIGALLELIQRYRLSVAAVVPPLVLALAKNPMVEGYDLSSIRIILSGAAPLGKELEDSLRIRVPQAILGQGYGMTEAGPVLSMCLGFAKQPFPTKSGSCGTVVRNAELKVIDPDTGSSLGYNQPGEICIRGQQIMKGYLNNQEATARTIDEEGWLHTGDIGYVDEDEEVFIVDRVKEIIKFKGFQVPPAELEAILLSHPSIADAAVVPQNDEAAGEVPVAFVVRSKSNGLEVIVTEEAIREFVAKQVVFYKRLHKVYFVHAIPKSPAGKILRKDLRAKLVGAVAAGARAPTAPTAPAPL